jgi:hypothetical protein
MREIKNRHIIITSSGGKCISGHTWTFSGGRDYVLEGTLCDCGMKKYEKPKYCDKCGQQLLKI